MRRAADAAQEATQALENRSAETGKRAAAAEEALMGTTADEDTLAVVAAAASEVCNPINDKRGTIAYREQVAGVLAKRAVLIAMQRAQQRNGDV